MNDRDIGWMLRTVAKHLGEDAKAMVERVSRNPFDVLVSTLLSLRTKDETTEPAAKRLLGRAGDPEGMLALSEATIAKLIYPVGFYRRKAGQLREASRLLLERHGGKVPGEMEALLALPGVGRKTANLVLSAGFGIPAICVDTHVHRITNRWGYVRTRSPEETERALREILPARYWIAINDWLVAYGQNLCAPLSPWCSRCRVSPWCARVGVGRSR